MTKDQAPRTQAWAHIRTLRSAEDLGPNPCASSSCDLLGRSPCLSEKYCKPPGN